ncbi:MAG TPA: ATP-binding protein [Myxococcaceae bacterium]|nr:ATP-binding protein [Myxococcaceae bacterium]
MDGTFTRVYPRFIDRRVREVLADTPVAALNGPRQSGKSTLAMTFAGEKRQYVTLDDQATMVSARRDPVGFIRELDRAVIDEVQRVPELLLAIKKSVDEDRRPGRFLLTGSADLLAVPTVGDSLAGRMEVIPLYPLSRGEVLGRKVPTFLRQVFSGRVPEPAERLLGGWLTSVVLAGGYPEVLARRTDRRRRDWRRAYVQALAKRDVRDISSAEKLDHFPRLIEALAHFSGQLVNLSSVGGELGIDHKTADRYLTILEHLFLVRRVRPWFGNARKRMVKTPKLHFLDSGLWAAVRGVTPLKLKVDRSLFGPALETFVHAELVKQSSWAEERVSLFHYRDKDTVEVDFVLEDEGGGVVGIEVKAAASVGAGDFKGLARLAALAGKDFRAGVLLYDGERKLPFGDRLFAAPVSCLWG